MSTSKVKVSNIENPKNGFKMKQKMTSATKATTKILALIIFVIIALISMTARAQRNSDPRLELHLGAGFNHAYWEDANGETSFEGSNIATHFTAMVGYSFRERWKRSTFGIFGTYGIDPDRSMEMMALNNDIQADLNGNLKKTNHKELEMGLLMGQWFRLSGGVGNAQFIDASEVKHELDYYTVTSGIVFGYDHAKINFGTTVMFGGDMIDPTWRLQLGVQLNLWTDLN